MGWLQLHLLPLLLQLQLGLCLTAARNGSIYSILVHSKRISFTGPRLFVQHRPSSAPHFQPTAFLPLSLSCTVPTSIRIHKHKATISWHNINEVRFLSGHLTARLFICLPGCSPNSPLSTHHSPTPCCSPGKNLSKYELADKYDKALASPGLLQLPLQLLLIASK